MACIEGACIGSHSTDCRRDSCATCARRSSTTTLLLRLFIDRQGMPQWEVQFAAGGVRENDELGPVDNMKGGNARSAAIMLHERCCDGSDTTALLYQEQ